MDRGMGRIIAWGIFIVGAICYGAYQANPQLTIGIGIASVLVFGLVVLFQRYKDQQLKRMVADVDDGVDRFRQADAP